jgi:nardilysin
VLQSDSCRLAQLRCHTARDGHPFQLFSWGNRRSLWEQPKAAGIAIRDRIVEYYRWPPRHIAGPFRCAARCCTLLAI